jgi:hypothetical protein
VDDSNIATVNITVNKLSPEEQVDKCLKSGIPPSLNRGLNGSLMFKLDQAIEKLEDGKTQAACNLLLSFINDVQGLINGGVLTASEGQALIDMANDIKADLNC